MVPVGSLVERYRCCISASVALIWRQSGRRFIIPGLSDDTVRPTNMAVACATLCRHRLCSADKAIVTVICCDALFVAIDSLRSLLVSVFDDQLTKVKTGNGFIAALDQSGGSTPKALGLYGVTEDAWSNDDEMFDLVHQMRTRIMTTPSFNGKRILGAILFAGTMQRQVEGRSTADYLWSAKEVVPFLKVDNGLDNETDDVQLMKPMPELAELLKQANENGIFGTKMRSVIKQANQKGVDAVVVQQFDVARQIIDAGLVPIVEPEVDIHCPDKAAAEDMLQQAMLKELDKLPDSANVMLKLTLPETANHYAPCMQHPRMVRVVALSGGYSREEANRRLGENHGMIASFSRALAEGLDVSQSAEEFDSVMDAGIESIYRASVT